MFNIAGTGCYTCGSIKTEAMKVWVVTHSVNEGEYNVDTKVIADVCYKLSDSIVYADKVIIMFEYVVDVKLFDE